MAFGILFVLLANPPAGACEQAPCGNGIHFYQENASRLIARKQFDQALEWSNKGLRLGPADPDLLLSKGIALLFLDRPKDALGPLNAVPKSMASCFYLGMAQRSLKDHLSARDFFREARQLGDEDAYVLYSLIEEDYALGDKPAGLHDFQTLLEKYPDSPWLHELLGDAYFSKDKDVEARTEYLKAISLKSDLLNVNFRLGYIAFQKGEFDSAASYFRKEVSINRSYVDAHVFLAETLLQLNKAEDAIAQLQTALKLDANSELIYRRLASALAEINRLPEAAATLQQAEKRFPKDPAFPAELSRVLKSLNRTKEAESAAARARQLIAEQHQKQEIAPSQ